MKIAALMCACCLLTACDASVGVNVSSHPTPPASTKLRVVKPDAIVCIGGAEYYEFIQHSDSVTRGDVSYTPRLYVGDDAAYNPGVPCP